MRNGVPVVALGMLMALVAMAEGAEPPLRVRALNFTVLPSTGPVTHVVVKNRLTADYTGTLRAQFPTGWKVTPAQHALALRPGEIQKLAFTIERGADVKTNAYPVRIQVQGRGGAMQVEQWVPCASFPYNKPVIDGDLAEWKDSIPITFATAGRNTTLSGYWSGKQFALAVEVEEDRLIGVKEAGAGPGLDAVQFALSPAEGEGRWEFLIAAADAAASTGQCYLLCKPGQDAALAGQRRSLAGLEFMEAKVAVKRAGKVTRYEVSVPFALMPELKPTAGREFFFSLLVHDPGDTGVRDLGEVMNLWPEDRQPGGWCSWEFVRWGDKTPWPSRIEFGFCSSIH